ncbi:MAG: NAD(+) synthase [Candidatus Brocadiia bacterium]
MKITVGQINATTGDFQGNLRMIRSSLEAAGEACADLAVFPACALTGWKPLALAREQGFLRRQKQALESLSRCVADVPVLLGHVSEKGTGEPVVSLIDARGRRVVARDGEAGRMDVDGLCVGILIGETERPAPVDCELVVSLTDRAFHVRDRYDQERGYAGLARRSRTPLLHAGLVGGNGEDVLPGGSALYDSRGLARAKTVRFEATTAFFDTDGQGRAPCGSEDEVADLYAALRLGLRDFVHKNGFRDAVLGLSGGIDSAVVAAVAADALGADHVVALVMPTRFSSQASREAAENIAANLGIHCRSVPIEGLRVEFEKALSPIFARTERGTAEENIQARIRGTVQMAYANKFGAMPLATGNRSELAVGYCTLYGDMTGGLAVIGDTPKTWVYRLAEHINRDGELIPEFVIERPPSAELKPEQKDRDVLPPYDVLDEVLGLYLDDGLSSEEIAARGSDAALVGEILAQVKRAGFKRVQAAPALKVYSGADWPHFPLAGRLVAPELAVEEVEDG